MFDQVSDGGKVDKPRISESTARRLLNEVVERARAVNSDPAFDCWVEHIAAHGAVTGNKPTSRREVQVAVVITERANANGETVADPLVRFDELSCMDTDVVKALQAGSRYIAIEDYRTMISAGSPMTPIYDFDPVTREERITALPDTSTSRLDGRATHVATVLQDLINEAVRLAGDPTAAASDDFENWVEFYLTVAREFAELDDCRNCGARVEFLGDRWVHCDDRSTRGCRAASYNETEGGNDSLQKSWKAEPSRHGHAQLAELFARRSGS